MAPANANDMELSEVLPSPLDLLLVVRLHYQYEHSHMQEHGVACNRLDERASPRPDLHSLFRCGSRNELHQPNVLLLQGCCILVRRGFAPVFWVMRSPAHYADAVWCVCEHCLSWLQWSAVLTRRIHGHSHSGHEHGKEHPV